MTEFKKAEAVSSVDYISAPPTFKDAEDIREGARRFWQRRNMAPPSEVNQNFGKRPKISDLNNNSVNKR
jgi:hypothetical protein